MPKMFNWLHTKTNSMTSVAGFTIFLMNLSKTDSQTIHLNQSSDSLTE